MTTLIVARGESPSGAAGDPDDDINHIYNGRFENAAIGLEGWRTNVGSLGVELTRETADPITGTGSLRYHVGSDTGGAGVNTGLLIRANDGHIGQTWRLTFKHRGEDVAMMVYLDYAGASDVESSVYFTAAAVVAEYSLDFVIPVGATFLDLQIGTDWNGAPQSNKTFWLDDIVLKRVALAP